MCVLLCVSITFVPIWPNDNENRINLQFLQTYTHIHVCVVINGTSCCSPSVSPFLLHSNQFQLESFACVVSFVCAVVTAFLCEFLCVLTRTHAHNLVFAFLFSFFFFLGKGEGENAHYFAFCRYVTV